MPRKSCSSTGARSICSKCGCPKNPSGYCPTCYQLRKSNFSTLTSTNTTVTAQQQRGNKCSKCGFTKNPSGYCPTCYKIKKNNAYQPIFTDSLPTNNSSLAEATCTKCGCIKNPSGYCPTCYQRKKKAQSNTQSTKVLVSRTARTPTNKQCSKCGYEKNSSGYCPTCYQRKKQEKEENAVYNTSLARDLLLDSATSLKEELTTSSLDEDYPLASTPIKKTTQTPKEEESGYITNESDDSLQELLSTSTSLSSKAISPITVTTAKQANPGNSTEATASNKSMPTGTTTEHDKSATTTNTTTSSSQTAAKQDELEKDFWLVSTIPPSTRPIGTTPVTITLLDKESTEWTYISSRVLQTMPQTTIQGIYKVYNEWLMERYKLAKRRMLHKNNNKIKEKILFHGTSKVPPSKIINSEFGFDFRHCSKGLWGTGTYFAVNASYSDSYSYKPAGTGYREILAAWVLIGESYRCEQDETLKRPPTKNTESDECYDTVCGHVAGSDVYVVYDHEKALPSYVIRYYTHTV